MSLKAVEMVGRDSGESISPSWIVFLIVAVRVKNLTLTIMIRFVAAINCTFYPGIRIRE